MSFVMDYHQLKKHSQHGKVKKPLTNAEKLLEVLDFLITQILLKLCIITISIKRSKETIMFYLCRVLEWY